jgi:uncharacterized protein YwbE
LESPSQRGGAPLKLPKTVRGQSLGKGRSHLVGLEVRLTGGRHGRRAFTAGGV